MAPKTIPVTTARMVICNVGELGDPVINGLEEDECRCDLHFPSQM
jgi:hypothetical protein